MPEATLDPAAPDAQAGARIDAAEMLVASQQIESKLPPEEQGPEDHHDEIPPLSVRTVNLVAIVAPFVALCAAIWAFWGVGFHWTELWLLLVGYVITGLGITIGFHRLLTHKSFETTGWLKAVFTIAGSMAAEGPAIGWAANHRQHHRHSDTHDDPHSPHLHGGGVRGVLRGLWHAHTGWLMTHVQSDRARWTPDLEEDKVYRFVDRTFLFWLGLSLVIPGVIGWAVAGNWVGGMMGFIWGGAIRILLVHHITWSVNSICHVWGSRPFRSKDESRNNPIVGVLAFGEGWHNNHHAFPASARHGLKWWQFDSSWIIIKTLEKVGLVWDVRVPTAERLAAKAR